MRKREPAGSGRASRDAACSGRASRPPRTTRTAGQHRGWTSRGLARCTCGGGCGVRVWGARAWARGVTMQRRGVQSTGGACRASGTGQVRRVAQVRLAAQVRLVRGCGSFAAQIRLAAYQQVKRAGSFGYRGTRGGHTTVGQRAVCRAARGSSVRVAVVRTGVALSSLACWLVILIRAGSSEVGARSPGADVGIAFVCMS